LAKDECEDLLNFTDLSEEQRAQVLFLLTVCCYRLGKLRVALMCLETVESQTRKLPLGHWQHAAMANLRGSIHLAAEAFSDAASSFHSAVELFEQRGELLEACRNRLNFANVLIELKKPNEAKRQALKAAQAARQGGFERQQAHALHTLGRICYDEGDVGEAESQFLQANVVARRGDFVPAVFLNCYYLWRIARARNDEPAARSNERTLRAYISRVDETTREAREFRQHLAGGGS
jgi:tetratricopeptide (TPR) repeat protein